MRAEGCCSIVSARRVNGISPLSPFQLNRIRDSSIYVKSVRFASGERERNRERVKIDGGDP